MSRRSSTASSARGGRVLHLDCFSGIAGNMFLGALLDLGLPRRELEADLDGLGVAHPLRLRPLGARPRGPRPAPAAPRARGPTPPRGRGPAPAPAPDAATARSAGSSSAPAS